MIFNFESTRHAFCTPSFSTPCVTVPQFPLLHFPPQPFPTASCRYFHSCIFHSRIFSPPAMTPRLSQPVVVYTLSLTFQHQQRAAVSDTSAMTRSADATSRLNAPSATLSTPGCRQRRQACAGTDRELATPLGYAAYI